MPIDFKVFQFVYEVVGKICEFVDWLYGLLMTTVYITPAETSIFARFFNWFGISLGEPITITFWVLLSGTGLTALLILRLCKALVPLF